MNRVFALIAAAWLVSCASAERETPAALLSSVDYSDGISRREADNIAEAYFETHVGCGSYSGISNSDEGWIVEGKFGFAGDPIKGFLIDKKTGAVKSTVGPSYAHPNEMLKMAGT
jgi:hypothetical protein